MAREACKIIINNGVKALMESLERILIDKDVYLGRLPEEVRLKLIQRLADIDLGSYRGSYPTGGLASIVTELEKYDLVTPEVWEVYKRPE